MINTLVERHVYSATPGCAGRRTTIILAVGELSVSIVDLPSRPPGFFGVFVQYIWPYGYG
jgi:hypothetical protein